MAGHRLRDFQSRGHGIVRLNENVGSDGIANDGIGRENKKANDGRAQKLTRHLLHGREHGGRDDVGRTGYGDGDAVGRG
jgi:hypothetical protein